MFIPNRGLSMFDTLLAIDYMVYSVVNGIAGTAGFLDNLMIFIAKYGPLVFDAYLLYLWFRGNSERDLELNRKLAIYAACSALVALGINQVLGHLYFRERPYIHHPAHLLLPSSPDPSFPSDHSAGGFSIATGILLGRRLPGIVLLAFSVVLAFSRVYVGLHYPSDVLGGALFGILGALVVAGGKNLLEQPIHWVFRLWDSVEKRLLLLKKVRW